MSITASSSAEIIPFQRQWAKGEFEALREATSFKALTDRRLSATTVRVFHFILWHVNRQSGGWPLCVETVADALGIEPRSARRCIAELEKYGYLRREAQLEGANFYSFAFCRADRRVRPPGPQSPPIPVEYNPVAREEGDSENLSPASGPTGREAREGSLSSENSAPLESASLTSALPPSPQVPRAPLPPRRGYAEFQYGSNQLAWVQRCYRIAGRPFPRQNGGSGVYVPQAELEQVLREAGMRQ